MPVAPAFRSLALDRLPDPDYVDVLFRALPERAPTDPVRWVEATFGVQQAPAWVRALYGLRQALVGLIGVSRGAADTVAVRDVVGDEALLLAEDRHLYFAAGLGVDADARLVRLTTTVRLKGWRGRVYFAPVRLLHRPVAGAMLRRAAHRLAQG